MDDFSKILPPEITAKAARSGNEWIISLPDAIQAVRLATTNNIAVLGLEAFHIQPDGFGLEGYSGYAFTFEGDWALYVRQNNDAALRFINENPAEPGHGYILTASSEKEFRTLEPPVEGAEGLA